MAKRVSKKRAEANQFGFVVALGVMKAQKLGLDKATDIALAVLAEMDKQGYVARKVREEREGA